MDQASSRFFMYSIKRLLKPILVPIWNRSCFFVWRTGEIGEALMRGRIARCAICGRLSPLVYRPWLITPTLIERWGVSREVAAAIARKESTMCVWCGGKLRNRRIAETLLDLYRVGSAPLRARSIVDWVRDPVIKSLYIAEINYIEGIHSHIDVLPHYFYSEYQDDYGDSAVRREDLTRLSYPSDSFDLVLTSETLEHVPDLDAALREILRVLKPGGRHIFTIPQDPAAERTFRRACLSADGTIEHHVTPLYHPAGDRGYLVFTEFGGDITEILDRAGFETELRFGPVTPRDLAQVYVCRKPARAREANRSDDEPAGDSLGFDDRRHSVRDDEQRDFS